MFPAPLGDIITGVEQSFEIFRETSLKLPLTPTNFTLFLHQNTGKCVLLLHMKLWNHTDSHIWHQEPPSGRGATQGPISSSVNWKKTLEEGGRKGNVSTHIWRYTHKHHAAPSSRSSLSDQILTEVIRFRCLSEEQEKERWASARRLWNELSEPGVKQHGITMATFGCSWRWAN